MCYRVALVSRIDKIIGLFCKRALQKRRYSAKEAYNFIDPTYHSHPIHLIVRVRYALHISICVEVCEMCYTLLFDCYYLTHFFWSLLGSPVFVYELIGVHLVFPWCPPGICLQANRCLPRIQSFLSVSGCLAFAYEVVCLVFEHIMYIYVYICIYVYLYTYIELPAKLLDDFLQSNKRNINQSMYSSNFSSV